MGHVGVGIVEEPRVAIDDFMVPDGNGSTVPITNLPLQIANATKHSENPELAEYLVRVKWLKIVFSDVPVKGRGFFGNQNTVARPKTLKWNHTVERLKQRVGID